MKLVAIAKRNPILEIGGKLEIMSADLVAHSDSNNELVGYSLNLQISVNCEINGILINNYIISNNHKLQTEFEILNQKLNNGEGRNND
jgi:hypothetical protein